MMARTVFNVVFVLASLTTLLLLSCAAASDEDDAAAAAAADSSQKSDGEAELKIEVISMPGECVQTTHDGNMLKVHYTGYLSNGKVFDSRYVVSYSSPRNCVLC
jgi:FKBP-type peptidyl-prolyl cis-trans isomerase